MNGPIGVGVLGATSWIYRDGLGPAFDAVEGVSVVHEASGSPGGDRVRRGRQSDDYAAVLADDDVDLVYIPFPNHLHEEWVLRAAAAGRHVLCEKPLGITAASAQRMADACAAAGVELVEAYMSPYHPRSAALRAFVADGGIGRVVHGSARMTGTMAADNHRWRVDAGGGALLDVGIYCLEPILTAMGWDGSSDDVDVVASSTFGGDGVDASTTAMLSWPDGRTLTIFVSFGAADQQQLTLVGTAGTVEVSARHATPDRRDHGFVVRAMDGTERVEETGTGGCYEGLVTHVRDVLRGEVALARPPSRSVDLAVLVDRIAAAAGHRRA